MVMSKHLQQTALLLNPHTQIQHLWLTEFVVYVRTGCARLTTAQESISPELPRIDSVHRRVKIHIIIIEWLLGIHIWLLFLNVRNRLEKKNEKSPSQNKARQVSEECSTLVQFLERLSYDELRLVRAYSVLHNYFRRFPLI